MEFLGDSIMQLVATEYLFIHFPDHHEGHLTVSLTLLQVELFPPPVLEVLEMHLVTRHSFPLLEVLQGQ